MEDYLMNLLQPKINERVKDAVITAVTTARADEHEKTTRTNLFLYVQKGGMSVDFAAHEAGLSVDNFRSQMNEYINSHKDTQLV